MVIIEFDFMFIKLEIKNKQKIGKKHEIKKKNIQKHDINDSSLNY